MSFSKLLKNELCKINAPFCCKYAEVYGILLFSKALISTPFVFTTESEDLIDHLKENCRKFFDVNFKISCSGTKKEIYNLKSNDENIKKIYNAFLSTDKLIIKQHIISDDCCKKAFLRGAFLACGYIDDPNKEYNLEFVLQDLTLAYEFSEFLEELGYKPKWSSRKNYAVLYFKDSEKIEDILTIMGAPQKTLELAEIKVYKDMRNHLNRTTNCMSANIGKTVNASVDQCKAINALINADLFNELSSELQFAANLRLKFPEASLLEIIKENQLSLSKSGLNHRLQKIISIAKAKGLV